MNSKRTSKMPRCMILFLVLIGAVSACGSQGQERATAQAAKDQAKQMAEALAPLCDGQPVPATAAYSQAAGVHPVLVLRGQKGGPWQVDTSYTRDEWEAQGLQNVELAACLQNEAILVETCPYKLENGKSVSVERYQYMTTVTLYEAKSGKALAETSLPGSEPERCSAETSFKEGELVKKNYGVAVGGREVGDWLQPYVELP
jgi:hypothetical protein